LQRYLLYFYPERLDIVQRATELAAALGGQLEPPRFSWKYAWIQRLFGWGLAKQAWIVLPGLKESLLRSWDKALFCFERRGLS
jgi:hypothetical protein